LLQKTLEVRFWKPYKLKLHDIAYNTSLQLMISIGVDDTVNKFPLKIWDVGQWNDNEATPKCKLSCSINISSRKSAASNSVQPTAVSVNNSLTVLAVGFPDPSVYFASGIDLHREKFLKFRMIHEGISPVGNGNLVGLVVATMGEMTAVVVITDKTLNSYVVDVDGNLLQKISHDAKGCERRCWHFNSHLNQLVVAGKEMIYFYDLEDPLRNDTSGNGRCHALSRYSDKIQLFCKDGFVCLLTKQISSLDQRYLNKYFYLLS